MRRFFRIFFITMGILFTLIIILFIYMIFQAKNYIREDSFSLKDHSVLKIEIQKPVPETPVNEMKQYFKLIDYNFYDLISTIDKAAHTPQIESIYLKISSSLLGWAQTEELISSLKDFQKSGKKIYAHFDAAGDKEFYLLSRADQIYCSPQSLLLLDGLASKIMFFKNTMQKIGVEFEAIKCGKFKSAVEPFTEDSMSMDYRKQFTSLLNSLTANYTNNISSNIGIENLDNIIEDGPYLNAEKIGQLGLVDGVLSEQEFFNQVEIDQNQFVSVSQLLKYPDPVKYSHSHQVALIVAEGNIMPGKSKNNSLGEETVIACLKKAMANSKIKAIVLRVNSPGGSGNASDKIWNYIEQNKDRKPIVCSMADYAASGGYYIAMNSSRIFCNANTITGSIGVFFIRPVLKKLYDKLDLRIETIRTAPNADMLYKEEKLNTQQYRKIQFFIDDFYQQFISKASQGRGLSVDSVDQIAQGRVWTGSQSVQNGLADQIGGLKQAIAQAASLAGIPEDIVPNVVVYPKPKTIIDELMSSDFFSHIEFLKFLYQPELMNHRGSLQAVFPYRMIIE